MLVRTGVAAPVATNSALTLRRSSSLDKVATSWSKKPDGLWSRLGLRFAWDKKS